MYQMMTGSFIDETSADKSNGQNSLKLAQGRISLTDEELARFNMELKGAFKDIVDIVEQNQVQAMNGLSQKQTEMF